MMKRFLSTLLMICMLISLFPSVALAVEDNALEVTEAQEQADNEDVLAEEQASEKDENADEEQPAAEEAPAPAEESAPAEEPVPAEEPAPAEESVPVEEPAAAEEPAEQIVVAESEPVIDQQDAAFSPFDAVDIDETNFPDATFRTYVASLDADHDDKLSPGEAEGVTSIDQKSKGIKDLKGIEYFSNLEELDISDNELTALDLHENTKLKKLNCSQNSLKSMNIRGCDVLEEFICDQNPALSEVYIGECALLEDAVHAVTPASAGVGTPMSCISGTTKLQYDQTTRLSHMAEWDDGEVTTEATCYTDGVMKYTCKHCARTKNEAIPATGDHILEEDVTAHVDPGPGAPGSATYKCTTPGCPYSEVKVLHATDLEGVEISTANFSDPEFRAFVKAYDTMPAGGDDFLQTDELNAVLVMDISGLGIKRLRGIEHFKKLTTLICADNEISCGGNSTTSLDLNANTELTTLDCSNNKLSSIVLTNCTKLTELRCDGNSFASMNVSNFPQLQTLSCSGNKISSLDLSKNTKLVNLYCQDNRISSLVLTKCTLLAKLDCSNNKLKSLDITKNTKLYDVNVSGNALSALTVSSCPKLHTVVHQADKTTADGVSTYDAGGTKLIIDSTVSITHLPSWKKTVKVEANCKTKTDGQIEYTCTVSGCKEKKIEIVSWEDAHKWEKKEVSVEPDETHPGKQLYVCSKCGATKEEDIPALEEGIAVTAANFPDEIFRTYVKDNIDTDKSLKLTEAEVDAVVNLDLSGRNIASLKGIEFFTKLQELNASNNQLGPMDLSKNTELTILRCDGNTFTRLRLENNVKLVELYCSDNSSLATLDISKCTALKKLYCYNNGITALDLSRLLALEELGCSDNKLASLDVSANKALKWIDCSGNPMSTIKLGSNSALVKLNCHDCPLTALDVSGCPNLAALDVIGAKFTQFEFGKNATLSYTYKNGTLNKDGKDASYTMNEVAAPGTYQEKMPYGLSNDGKYYSQMLRISTAVDAVADSYAVITSRSLFLVGNVGLNFYVTIPDNFTTGDNAKAVIYAEGGAELDSFKISELTPNSSGEYLFTHYGAAKEMRDNVVLKLFDNNSKLFPMRVKDSGEVVTSGYTFSVQDYFDLAKEKSTNQYLLSLLARMSDFGYCAQLYFNYNTAGVSITPEMQSFLTPVTLDSLKGYQQSIDTVNDGGIEHNGSSLLLESETTIRHYFKVTKGAVEDYTFVVDGTNVDPVAKDGEYYVSISHIAAKDLGVAHSVQVKDKNGNVVCSISNYSALSWAYSVVKAGGGGRAYQLDIAQSLYNYNQAAILYFANR